jgi:hypothetical protein
MTAPRRSNHRPAGKSTRSAKNAAAASREAATPSELDQPPLKCDFCGAAKRAGQPFIRSDVTERSICVMCLDLGSEILLDSGERLPRTELAINGPNLVNLGPAPRFRTVEFQRRPSHCFYLCPFREPFDTVYRDHVKSVVEAQGFSIERVDEVYGTNPIIDDIWVGINASALVIADLTTRNGNVMYEVGLAHTVGKPVIMLTQTIEDVPFDLRHYRCIVYEYTPRGMKVLEERLARTLEPWRKVEAPKHPAMSRL